MALDPSIIQNIELPKPIDLLGKYQTMQNLRTMQMQQADIGQQIEERRQNAIQRDAANKKAEQLVKLYQDAGVSGEDQSTDAFRAKVYAIDPTFGQNHDLAQQTLATGRANEANLKSEAANRETPAERIQKHADSLIPAAEREYQAWRAASSLPDNAATRIQYKVQGQKMAPGDIISGAPGQPPIASAPEKPPTDDFQAVYLPAKAKQLGKVYDPEYKAPNSMTPQEVTSANDSYKQSSKDPVMEGILRENAANVRLDRSYNSTTTELENKRKPIDAESANIAQAKSLLSQNNPSANALAAPAIIKAVVGGQGSGVRITTPEINAINGGRGKIDNFQSWLSSWSLDPSKYQALLPDQKMWLNGVLNKLDEKIQAKQAAVSSASKAVRLATDVDTHRKTLNDLEDNLAAIDRGAGQATAAPTTGFRIVQ